MKNQIVYNLGLVTLFTGIFTFTNQKAFAQLIPDSTLGAESSQINNINSTTAQIESGATRGINLFHSFQEFNVDVGKTVNFANPINIENILTRVTGSNVSNILGTLGVNGNANLFLINPNGIYFGTGATLNIQGSFTATTANEIKLGDTGLFSAKNPQTSNLLNIQPNALFTNALKNQQAEIKNEGNLQTGKDLTLSGINVTVKDSTLKTGGDLILEAQETVKIEDSINKPVILESAGNITIQGNQSIEINALNHPDSNFTSNRDIVFRSPVRLLSNGRYTVGGYFTTEDLNQNTIDFLIPHNNVIKVNGDIKLEDYTGSSLYILASGKVTTGNVTINNPDYKSINQDISDGQGGNQIITVNSKNDVGLLDIRAGIDPEKMPGILDNNPILPSGVTATVNNHPTSADILSVDYYTFTVQTGEDSYTTYTEIKNTYNFINYGGSVFLTNEYKPNHNLLSNSANIIIGNIDTYINAIDSPEQDGGTITINSRGNISTKSLAAYSYTNNQDYYSRLEQDYNNNYSNNGYYNYSNYYNYGNYSGGGQSQPPAYSGPFFGKAGYGGIISLTSGGNITTESLSTEVISSTPTVANAGTISLNANQYITTGNINSYSSSSNGNSGDI
ncbi:filamentous hemagglutinin N-terminal domain-containing protein, partial [Anabaena sp. UHCC 0204]